MSSASMVPEGWCDCVRCQQLYKPTPTYQITHICRQCKNKLTDAWQKAEKGK